MPPIMNTERNSIVDIGSSSKPIYLNIIDQVSRRESEMRTTSPALIPDIFNPNPYPNLRKSNAFSPRSSQKLKGFLNFQLGSSHNEELRRGRKDYQLFYGSQKSNNLNTNVRIRGKSNIIDTQAGSFLHSIHEQKVEIKRKNELKQAKK